MLQHLFCMKVRVFAKTHLKQVLAWLLMQEVFETFFEFW